MKKYMFNNKIINNERNIKVIEDWIFFEINSKEKKIWKWIKWYI